MDWSEKYRPTIEEDYVFPQGKEGEQMRSLLHAKRPENLILYGKPGRGKTTFARLYANQFGAGQDSPDFKVYLATELKGVEDIREKLLPFTKTAPWFGEYKFIHLEESDHLTSFAVSELKTLMEGSKHCVYMLTTNNLTSIDKALQSRSACINCKLDSGDVAKYILSILKKEGIEFKPENVMKLLGEIEADNGLDLRMMLKAVEREYA